MTGTRVVLKFLFLLTPLVFGLYSCKDKKDDLILDFKYDYAPYDTGHYIIYDVDSITYTFSNSKVRDTVRYQLKEILTDTFYDNLGEVNLQLERFARASENDPWVYDRKWYVQRNTTNYIKREDDLKFVKLVFPLTEGEEWDGNIYVSKSSPFEDFRDWVYAYENVDVPYSINGMSFDSTASVLEVDDQNAISKRLRREVYARGVGLIYQEWEILHTTSGTVFQNWDTGYIEGFRIRMKVHEYN